MSILTTFLNLTFKIAKYEASKAGKKSADAFSAMKKAEAKTNRLEASYSVANRMFVKVDELRTSILNIDG